MLNLQTRNNPLKMKTIPFDIKYRPEIVSGKYKLVNSEGKNVTVLDWEFHRGDSKVLIVKIARANGYEDAVLYTHDGKRISQIEDHLSIVTDEPEGLTEFEKEVQVASFLEIHPSDVDAIKEQAAHLLELARKELDQEIGRNTQEHIESMYQEGKKEGIKIGKAEALKDMPRWHKVEKGGCFDKPMNFLLEAKEGHFYCSSWEVPRDGFLLFVDELEKLPKEDPKDQ